MTPEQLQILLDMNNNMKDMVDLIDGLRSLLYIIFAFVGCTWISIIFRNGKKGNNYK